MQQIRNPDLTLEEMVRMEGSLVHLVEEGEEIVGVEGNSIHLVEGGEEIVRVERNSVHLVEGEEEMVGMDGLAHLVAGGEGEILIKAVEEVLYYAYGIQIELTVCHLMLLNMHRGLRSSKLSMAAGASISLIA